MSLRPASLLFLLVPLLAAAYVWQTSAALPDLVASHFGVDGAANGHMPRDVYRGVMLLFCIVVPLLIGWLPSAAAGKDGRNLKLPNRDYWLAPERRDDTLQYLQRHGQWLAAVVVSFLAYVHHLVARANALQPPRLNTSSIVTALVVLFLFLAVWICALYARFLKDDPG